MNNVNESDRQKRETKKKCMDRHHFDLEEESEKGISLLVTSPPLLRPVPSMIIFA